MRILRAVAVVLVLAAPVVVVTLLAWPSGGEGRARERASGSGPGGELVAGDDVDDQLGINEVARYQLLGDEGVEVRIGVRGQPPMDATLTVLDASGDEVAFNDDTNGLDPEVTVELDGGEYVVEVRELGGRGGTYRLFVDEQ